MVAKWVRSSAIRGRSCWRQRRCVGSKFFLGCGIKPFREKVDSGMYNSTIRRQHVLKEFVVFFTVYMYTLNIFKTGFVCIALVFRELALHFQAHVLFTWHTLCCWGRMQRYARNPQELCRITTGLCSTTSSQGLLSGGTSARSQCTELVKEVQLAEQALTIKVTHFTLRIIIFLFSFQRKHQGQMRYG